MKRLVAFSLAALFAALCAPAAFACSCMPASPVAKARREAAAVFSGRFVGAEYRKGIVNELAETIQEAEGVRQEYEVLVLRFEVEEWWKGGPAREVVIVTNGTRAADGTETVSMCDFQFEEGESYLVYAYESKSGLQTGYCTRTKNLKRAARDLKALGRGQPPRG